MDNLNIEKLDRDFVVQTISIMNYDGLLLSGTKNWRLNEITGTGNYGIICTVTCKNYNEKSYYNKGVVLNMTIYNGLIRNSKIKSILNSNE